MVAGFRKVKLPGNAVVANQFFLALPVPTNLMEITFRGVVLTARTADGEVYLFTLFIEDKRPFVPCHSGNLL